MRLMQIITDRAGHEIVAAGKDVETAVGLVFEYKPDVLVVSSFQCWGAVDEVRLFDPYVAILLVTSSSLASPIPGIDAFMAAPYDPREWVETIEAIAEYHPRPD